MCRMAYEHIACKTIYRGKKEVISDKNLYTEAKSLGLQ